MVREENGFPVRGPSGHFNTADLVGKLTGVSLNQVIRVIAALDAIGQTLNVPASLLIEVWRTPTALPDAERSAQTVAAYAAVCEASDLIDGNAWELLKPGKRAA